MVEIEAVDMEAIGAFIVNQQVDFHHARQCVAFQASNTIPPPFGWDINDFRWNRLFNRKLEAYATLPTCCPNNGTQWI